MCGLNTTKSERTQTVLVRPEHIQISPIVSTTNQLTAQVEGVIFRGERYELSLSLPNGEALLAHHHSAPKLGSQVAINLHQGWCLEPD